MSYLKGDLRQVVDSPKKNESTEFESSFGYSQANMALSRRLLLENTGKERVGL